MDSATQTLKKVYKKAKYLIFPAECTSRFNCITSPLDNLRCKQQLEKVLPVQIELIWAFSDWKISLCC